MSGRSSVATQSEAHRALVERVARATSTLSSAELRAVPVLRRIVEELADEMFPSDGPLVKARLRGAIAMRELLSDDGGALTGPQVAELLGISRQAVDKRRKAGQVLAVELPRRGLLYPAWQFEPKVRPHVEAVLAALRAHDAWAQARFFVTRSD